jgi:hypothetical protein
MNANVLIVTDGRESSRLGALAIVSALFGDGIITIRKDDEFSGTDILAADFCFFGCSEPEPASFSYLDRLLRHINLRLKKCALFSMDSNDAIGYLKSIIKDSGIKLVGSIVSSEPIEIKEWAERI